jgi:SAM-dependent methyltransferase
VDIWKFFDVGHTDHVFCNPMSEAKFDEMVGLVKLAPEDRVLDIACGKAEFLLRLAQRWRCGGVGVDLSPPCVADARANISQVGLDDAVEIVHVDGARYEAPPASFRAAVCLGASWIWGGYAGMLDAMSGWATAGGFVLVGEPFWRKQPSADHLQASSLTRVSFDSHAGNVRTGIEKGLVPLYSIVSSEDDWDRYQGLQWAASEGYARQNPDDPDVPELLEATRRNRDHYLDWGRDELGWAIYLFMKA